PSYKEMKKLCETDEQVSQYYYEHIYEHSEQWMNLLEVNNNGSFKSNAHNIKLILQNDENLKDKFAYNLLSHRMEVKNTVPWSRLGDNTLSDFDDSSLRNYLSRTYDIKAKDVIFDGLNEEAMNNRFHPIRDYLISLKWDGQKRLDTLIIDLFDADDTQLNRMMTRLYFVGAVKRVFEPGCKMDYVLTLKGNQGIGKSSFLGKMAVEPNWFTDSIIDLRSKDSLELFRGHWLIELGEMAAVGKGDQKRTKQVITSQIDTFRESYGRRTQSYPRQCVFAATTNDDEPLKDD